MKKSILFWSLLVIFSTKMTAQQLTLQRVVDGGIKNNKTLLADKSKIEAAIAHYDATYSNLYPSVKLSGGYTRQSYVEPFGIASKDPATGQPITLKLGEAIENVTQFRAGLQQTIYADGRTRYAVESAKLLTEAARLDVEKDKSEVQMNLINVFYNVYKLQVTQLLLSENRRAA